MRKQGKTREISKKHNKKQGEQQKTMENKGHGKIEKNMRKRENIGKQAEENREKHRKTRRTQENKETRENRKKQGVRVENARKQWKKGEMWKKLNEM